MAEFKKPEPLKIKCTASDCDNDLHCFKATRKMAQADRGRCRACGADLVDWHRLHQREIADAKCTFRGLKHELIRHHFFHETLEDIGRVAVDLRFSGRSHAVQGVGWGVGLPSRVPRALAAARAALVRSEIASRSMLSHGRQNMNCG
jgi:hypothetical protein